MTLWIINIDINNNIIINNNSINNIDTKKNNKNNHQFQFEIWTSIPI